MSARQGCKLRQPLASVNRGACVTGHARVSTRHNRRCLCRQCRPAHGAALPRTSRAARRGNDNAGGDCTADNTASYIKDFAVTFGSTYYFVLARWSAAATAGVSFFVTGTVTS